MTLFRMILAVCLWTAFPVCSRAAEPVPDSIVLRGDRYIISQVGKEYFAANYKFRPDKSYGQQGEYFLEYEYLPASRLSPTGEFVFVRIFSSPRYVPQDVVADIRSGYIVEPVITQRQAAAIIAQHNVEHFSPDKDAGTLLAPSGFYNRPNWVWEFSINIPDQDPECGSSRVVTVDANSGEFRDLGTRHWCY